MAHFLEFSESSSKTPFLSCTVICVILDHKSWSGSSQRNAPLISDPKSDGIFDPWSRERGVDPTGLFIYYCPSLSISSYDLNTKPILTTFGPRWNCLQLLSLQKKSVGYWSNEAFKCYCGSFFIHSELSPFYGIIRESLKYKVPFCILLFYNYPKH